MPFLVSATSGTTVLGAFDPLEAIADVCQRHGLWLHVDVSETWAWGGGELSQGQGPHYSFCSTGRLGWERPVVTDTQTSPGWDPEVHTATYFLNPTLQILDPENRPGLGSFHGSERRRLVGGVWRDGGLGLANQTSDMGILPDCWAGVRLQPLY